MSDHIRRRRIRFGVTIVLLLAVTVGAVGWWLGSGRWTDVPAVSGQGQQQAIGFLQEAGLDPVVTEVFSEDVAAGTVISADPADGARIIIGSDVQLSVSKGPERFTVDGGLLGQPADDVQATIEGLGADLQVTRTTGRSDDVAAGAVMALDPAPGTELRRGDTVTLQVSEGPATAAVRDLVARDPDDAEATLAALGFEVERTEGRSDAVSAGQVAAVSPDGTETFGATITLTVSVGPVQVSVPNVVGQSKDAAVAALEAVGLEASVTQFFGDTVLRQTPAAGEVVDPGTSVTILVTFG
ncbi:hypothetical protein GCM10023162_37670 [Klenkia terrae]